MLIDSVPYKWILFSLEIAKRHLWVSLVVVTFSGQSSKTTLTLLKFEITQLVYFSPVSWHLMFFSHKIICNMEPPSKSTCPASLQNTPSQVFFLTILINFVYRNTYFYEQCFLTASGKFNLYRKSSKGFHKSINFYQFARLNKLFCICLS